MQLNLCRRELAPEGILSRSIRDQVSIEAAAKLEGRSYNSGSDSLGYIVVGLSCSYFVAISF